MTDERTTAYLLQELTEREAEQFEEQCFAQPEWPASDLDSAEDDLIEAYLRKELTPDRQRRFEKKYLTTNARKERLLLAESFLRVVCSTEQPKLTWIARLRGFWNVQPLIPKYATLAAIFVLGVALLLWYWSRPSAPRTFANINLTNVALTRRSNDAPNAPTQKVTLPLGADALRISLTLPDPAPKGATYRVRWENVKGVLKDLQTESPDPNSVQVDILAGELVPGQYTLKLFRKNPDGTEQRVNGDYFFNVE